MGTLASEIAHEVGTPLNVISGRVELLAEREKLNEHITRDLTIINQQIERISKIIRRRLDVTRKSEPRTGVIEIGHLLNSLVEFLRTKMEKESIRVNLSISNGLRVHGDEDQLQQVFLNILMNAIQAFRNGGIIWITSTMRMKKGTHFVEVRIRDNGHGISLEHLDRIFDPFFSTKMETGGTGLGLSVVKDIIKRHAGEISVESRLGQGTEFTLLLPAASYISR
ncbi:MAG TPA: ATP-binding protein [Acidobacteriota bacterium]|nr:ATP-binding protein [Acidobacteriota bacterium]